MASIIIADKTRHYDGTYLEKKPLGGTESSVIQLARELARRSHAVTVYSTRIVTVRSSTRASFGSRFWERGLRPAIFISPLHQPELLGFVKRPMRRAIWVVWPVNPHGGTVLFLCLSTFTKLECILPSSRTETHKLLFPSGCRKL
jgi:hypothetical protein